MYVSYAYDEYWHSGNSSSSITNKLRVQKIKEFKIEAEPLKINKKYALNLVYDCEAIIEKPSKWERKCKRGFLGKGKKCKNVEVAQSFSENEMKEVNKEIRDKLLLMLLLIYLKKIMNCINKFYVSNFLKIKFWNKSNISFELLLNIFLVFY